MSNRTIAIICYAVAAISAVLIVGGYLDERGSRYGGGATDVSLGELWWPAFVALAGVFIQFGWPRVRAWLAARERDDA